MRVAVLASGSSGNASLVVGRSGAGVLVDAGLSARTILGRLAACGVPDGTVRAIVVTHEHIDHVRGLGPLARRLDLTVFATRGTLDGLPDRERLRVEAIGPSDRFEAAGLSFAAFPIPHDAAAPVGLVVREAGRAFGFATDLGFAAVGVVHALEGVDALALEANHDLPMLLAGRYTPALKERIRGRFGHLSNEQAAGLLDQLDRARIGTLVAMHLSAENNTPDLARGALERTEWHRQGGRRLLTASRQAATEMFEV